MHRPIIPILALGFVAAGGAQAQTLGPVGTACGAATNLPTKICECVDDRAEAELDDDQRAFVVAMLMGDDAETARLRGQLSASAMIDAATFVTDAPADCAGS